MTQCFVPNYRAFCICHSSDCLTGFFSKGYDNKWVLRCSCFRWDVKYDPGSSVWETEPWVWRLLRWENTAQQLLILWRGVLQLRKSTSKQARDVAACDASENICIKLSFSQFSPVVSLGAVQVSVARWAAPGCNARSHSQWLWGYRSPSFWVHMCAYILLDL